MEMQLCLQDLGGNISMSKPRGWCVEVDGASPGGSALTKCSWWDWMMTESLNGRGWRGLLKIIYSKVFSN